MIHSREQLEIYIKLYKCAALATDFQWMRFTLVESFCIGCGVEKMIPLLKNPIVDVDFSSHVKL